MQRRRLTMTASAIVVGVVTLMSSAVIAAALPTVTPGVTPLPSSHARDSRATSYCGDCHPVTTPPPAPSDTTPPVTTSDAKASYVGGATIRLTATDAGSGVDATYYRLDNGSTTMGDVVTVSAVGQHQLRFWSTDLAGNGETVKTVTFVVTAPPAPEPVPVPDPDPTPEPTATPDPAPSPDETATPVPGDDDDEAEDDEDDDDRDRGRGRDRDDRDDRRGDRWHELRERIERLRREFRDYQRELRDRIREHRFGGDRDGAEELRERIKDERREAKRTFRAMWGDRD